MNIKKLIQSNLEDPKMMMDPVDRIAKIKSDSVKFVKCNKSVDLSK